MPEDENQPQDTQADLTPEETSPEPEGMVETNASAVKEAESELNASEENTTEAEETSEAQEANETSKPEPLPSLKKKRRENPDVEKARAQFDEMVDESEEFFDKASRISEGISAEAEVKDKVFERKNIAYEIEAAAEDDTPERPDSEDTSAEDKPEWKQKAEKIYEERSSRKQRMVEERRKMDELVREKQRKREEALRGGEQETRERILADARKRREEKERAVQEMMQRAREERERKRREALGLSPADEPPAAEQPPKSSNLDERTSRLAKDEDEE
jgi:hypothetical protein